MYSFYVNSHLIKTDQDKKLLHFLRENLGLYGTKDGCDEGSCGSCTVIIDDKAMKSCIVKTSKLEGAHVTTIEGLSLREQAVYGYCFAKEGAVQCGFCTPGMIMSAKALLKKNLNPSLEEIQFALRGNICRCTGYKKIEKAILEVARYLRENLPTPDINQVPRLNMPYIRPDAIPKAMGRGEFADDIHLEGMLHLRVLRSAYPRAKIVKLDLTKAKGHPDCVEILTSKDVPQNILGHIVHDWDVMISVG
ncbi:MAG: 2Fe-2S iron-sulfur cluster-binding protein, partial [Sphaerochaetaceae bacterium]